MNLASLLGVMGLIAAVNDAQGSSLRGRICRTPVCHALVMHATQPLGDMRSAASLDGASGGVLSKSPVMAWAPALGDGTAIAPIYGTLLCHQIDLNGNTSAGIAVFS